MCLAVPSKIISTNDMMATIEAYGARKDVSLLRVPEPIDAGDYVLVHPAFSIQRVDRAAAEDALVLIKQMVDEFEKEEKES